MSLPPKGLTVKEPIIVTHAQMEPYACCVCTNTTGPFSDTFFEDRFGRKYLCLRCVKTNARIHGLASGKRLDELSNVAATVEGKDAEIAALQAQVEELRASQRSEGVKVRELRVLLENAEGKLQTAVHIGAALESAAGELVKMVAPVAEAVAA